MDYDDEGDITDLYEPDEWEEAEADCSQFLDGGVIVCGAAGSEWCDFECPLRCDLGLTPQEAQDRAIEEVLEERRQRIALAADPWFDASAFDISSRAVKEE